MDRKKLCILLGVLCICAASAGYIGQLRTVGAQAAPVQMPEISAPREDWAQAHLTIEGELSEEYRAAILPFMEGCWSSCAELKAADITACFTGDREGVLSAALNQQSLEVLCASRLAQRCPLTFSDYFVTLELRDIFSDESGVNILLRERSSIWFDCCGGVESCSAGIIHLFVLAREDGELRIRKHSKSEDIYHLIKNEYEYELGQAGLDEDDIATADIPAFVAAIGRQLIAEARDNAAAAQDERIQFLASPEAFLHPQMEFAHPYDYSAAVEYAYTWVSAAGAVRNPLWPKYDLLGGNCNNYTSQCLLAGGIPMDAEGDLALQWKWCGDELDARASLRGRSPSWSGVSEFWNYCLYNDGSGLAAYAGGNIWAGEPGDILQLGAANVWRHSVIITGAVYDESGNIADYLICSNTTDRLDYPACAYAYTDRRLIKILGYN